MGQIIFVTGQKGGPGKSTLARAIATSYAAAEWDVKIADLDINQSTSFEWQQRRLRNEIEPFVGVETFGSAAQALKQAEHYDLLIVDGAPTASRTTAEVSQVADLIVIPTGLGIDDLKPSVVLANNLQKSGISKERICFIFNRALGSELEYQEAIEFLKQTPFHLVEGRIEEKPSYRQAMNEGRSIVEVRFKQPRIKADQVIQGLIDRLESINDQ